MSHSLFVCVKLCSLDFKSMCVLLAVCLPYVYHQYYILNHMEPFRSWSSKCSCFDLFIHTTFNVITPSSMPVK